MSESQSNFFIKFYLTYIRPIVKIILHLITMKTEIQRAALSNNHQEVRLAIKRSKVLKDFVKGQLNNRQSFNADLAAKFCKIKRITNQRNKFYVVKILRQIYASQDALRLVSARRKQKYSVQNSKHQQKLLKIWKNLKKRDIKQRYTTDWISIGFQDKDPATDFRGAGVLGLENLYQFTSKKCCDQIFKVASDPKTEYFFASAGLYFTMLGQQLLKMNLIPEQYWLGTQTQKIYNFQKVYNYLFVQFHKFWLSCDDKSLMGFNTNLDKFAKMMKSNKKKFLKQEINKCSQEIQKRQ